MIRLRSRPAPAPTLSPAEADFLTALCAAYDALLAPTLADHASCGCEGTLLVDVALPDSAAAAFTAFSALHPARLSPFPCEEDEYLVGIHILCPPIAMAPTSLASPLRTSWGLLAPRDLTPAQKEIYLTLRTDKTSPERARSLTLLV